MRHLPLALLLPVAQPAPDRTEHVGIIVGPDPLLLVSFGQFPLVRRCQLADVGLLARRHHHRGREDVLAVAPGILAIDPALEIVLLGDADDDAGQFQMPVGTCISTASCGASSTGSDSSARKLPIFDEA